MKPSRIVFLVLFVGALSWGYLHSMRPIVRYEAASPLGGRPAAEDAAAPYRAYATENGLYAEAARDGMHVQIQGVYRSPRDGSLEVAVLERPAAPGEQPQAAAVRIRLPANKWPQEVVFRDVTGNLLARAGVAAARPPAAAPVDGGQ